MTSPCLFTTIVNGHLEQLRQIIKYEPTLDITPSQHTIALLHRHNIQNKTPLMVAMSLKRHDIVSFLLKRHDTVFTIELKKTILYTRLALLPKHIMSTVVSYLQTTASINASIVQICRNIQTRRTQSNSNIMLKQLMQHTFNQDLVVSQLRSKQEIMYFSRYITHKHETLMKRLYLYCLQDLLDRKLNHNEWALISMPSRVHKLDSGFVNQLIYHNIDLDYQSTTGKTLLMMSLIYKGSIDSKLVTNGVDVNIQDNIGATPLMWAARYMPSSIVMLIKAGANVSKQDNSGATALMWAARYMPSSIVALVKAGANVNIKDNNGVTALGWVARHAPSSIDAVVDAGADVNKQDRQDSSGATALGWVAEHNRDLFTRLQPVLTPTLV